MTVPKAVTATAAASKQCERHLYIGKKQVPSEPLTPVGRKLPLDREEAITVSGEVLSKQTWKETSVMLDIGAEVNVINQRFAMECNFKTLNAELPTYSWLNKTQAHCYEAYKVPLRMKDSWEIGRAHV